MAERDRVLDIYRERIIIYTRQRKREREKETFRA